MTIGRIFLAIAVLACSQDILDNDSIVRMVKAGLAENLVISMVRNQPGKYTMTPDDLVKLKQQGVPDKVLAEMIAKGTGTSSSSLSPSTNAFPGDRDVPANLDVGLYFKKGGNWEEMLPEVVNWKTGGVIKHLATAGVVKGDVNGHINGAHSRNSTASPLEIFIYAPEGVSITEYQLLHLHENPDSREFRTVTGGILHESGGTTRDVIPFEGKKVANRMFKILLPKIGAGEYGFLPPEAVSLAKGASIGKIYSFRLVE